MKSATPSSRHLQRNLLDPLPIWLSGVMLSTAILMIAGLIGLIMVNGLGMFWPKELWRVTLQDGSHYLGLVHDREEIPRRLDAGGQPLQRTLYRIGNRDLSGVDFVWVDDHRVAARVRPAEAVSVERLEWGPFFGFLKALQTPEGAVEGSPERLWLRLRQELPEGHRRYARIRRMERKVIGDINRELEERRLAIRRLELQGRSDARKAQAKRLRLEQEIEGLEARYGAIAQELEAHRSKDQQYRAVFAAVDGQEKGLPVSALVRVYRPNQLSWLGRLGVYFDRLREFIFGEPREANSEGGVAPAIFGTVMMMLLMSMAVVPLGVLAALYLHEYAKQGALVSMVRIAVNNLAGVPSIVFGVFGLGFFCYLIGGTIDRVWFPERLPSPTFGGGGILWASLTLALLTVPVVIVATEEALSAVPRGVREASLACGATQFQTIWRVVLPAATPGVLTGTILAMARGAGEVAPLMITGVVKLAPDLPIDHHFPFFHLERKFMHLGFHIYDVGFQSPNVEASKAMVYMTALLLLAIVVGLNLLAVFVRGRLRAQFRTTEV